MKALAIKIERTVVDYARLLGDWDDVTFSEKKLQTKWSRKEILGHLVDSAQNNLQRFIRAQYEVSPKVTYLQDDWVKLGHYQKYHKDFLIELWAALNKHLCHVLTEMDPANYSNLCTTSDGEQKTLEFFAEDYLRHMIHHLSQIEKKY